LIEQIKFIPESIIDKVVKRFESRSEEYDLLIKEFDEHQPQLLAYLCSESFDLLTGEERNYLMYLSLIIWQTVVEAGGPSEELNEDIIVSREEANWARMKNVSERKFRDRVTPFFENYPQEDLLAFIEDALVYDEENDEIEITKEGREYLFVTMKTVIDSLCRVDIKA